MSNKKRTSIWTKEIYYLLASPIDEFSDSLFSLPHSHVENIVRTLLTAADDEYALLNLFNAKITHLKSDMEQLPNAKKALRKLDVVCKLSGALGYFDALIELSGKWESLKTHSSIDIHRDKKETLPIDYLFLQCRKFDDDFEILKAENVIGINDDGSLKWKWQKTALCEYFYYYECHLWRLIEKVFNTKNLKQLFNSHIEQQNGKFSSDYEKLRALLRL